MVELYSPGPDGNAGDNWNEHELGLDALHVDNQQ